jgi:CBS domain-containing protein
MGEQNVSEILDAGARRRFTQRLLADLRALEILIQEGAIESGVHRMGAEQELFLVDSCRRPAPIALELLAELDDPSFTTELGRFNLEYNLDPIAMGGDGLSRLEAALSAPLERVRQAARRHGAEAVLTGILPTLDKSDLTLANMTPKPRYLALDEALRRLRGEEYLFRIKGCDELLIRHDNMMLEACNTSFQIHFQVGAEEFAARYNAAQAVAAPVLAAAANSPLLFGRHLWQETRIALFEQSVDTRLPVSTDIREQTPRVSFGRRWVERSVLEILREDVARFPVLFGAEGDEDPLAEIRAGRAPRLAALCTYNGTVYRWNRPCYGISGGRPHLRIENRVLPAGPSVVDEVANAALWIGLVQGVCDRFGDIARVMAFEEARDNFTAAARLGVGSHLVWPGCGYLTARDLLLTHLLPLAYEGLAALGFDAADAARYLGVIEERVRLPRTGAIWLIESLAGLKEQGTRAERLAALVGATCQRQQTGRPVAEWEPARLEEAGGPRSYRLRVGQLMSTDLFTVNEHELVDLVAYVMGWKHIRHVPVEDAQHRLVGFVTHRALLRLIGDGLAASGGPGAMDNEAVPVGRIMQRDVVTVTPDTPALTAIGLMKTHKISGMPVVDADGRLVGIITERDFMQVAGQLLEQYLGEDGPAASSAEPRITETA